MKVFEKDPDEIKDYGFDWTLRIGADTITDSVWSINPVGELAVTAGGEAFQDGFTTVLLENGVADKEYIVSNLITVSNGRKVLDQFKVVVRELNN